MGEIDQALYDRQAPRGEAETKARAILKGGTMIFRDCYRYHGDVYWIVGGRVLTKEQAARLEDERRREGRTPQRVTMIRTHYGD